jgi:hypothetical protein
MQASFGSIFLNGIRTDEGVVVAVFTGRQKCGNTTSNSKTAPFAIGIMTGQFFGVIRRGTNLSTLPGISMASHVHSPLF